MARHTPLLAGLSLAALAAYAVWSRSERRCRLPARESAVVPCESFGVDGGTGNLVGVQPWMHPADYATPARFHAKLAGYLRTADAHGFLTPRTVVVFPEYLGAWLVVEGEKSGVYQAPTLAAAMRLLALSNLPGLLGPLLQAATRERLTAALFRMKASQMAALYQAVFSRLAQEFGCTLVAGSLLLPAPRVEAGRLRCGRGPLQNVTGVFSPTGALHPALVRKAFPTSDEQGFLSGAPLESLPVFDTPAGRLGVLICADAWYPQAYAHLRALGVELVVVPAYIAGERTLTRVWNGYDGAPTPPDVTPADIGTLTEAQAWTRYALAGRLATAGAHAGMLVSLRGRLWDLGTGGGITIVTDQGAQERGTETGGSVVNLWLPASSPGPPGTAGTQ
jgi:predicted amidohydrolase